VSHKFLAFGRLVRLGIQDGMVRPQRLGFTPMHGMARRVSGSGGFARLFVAERIGCYGELEANARTTVPSSQFRIESSWPDVYSRLGTRKRPSPSLRRKNTYGYPVCPVPKGGQELAIRPGPPISPWLVVTQAGTRGGIAPDYRGGVQILV